MSKIRHWLAHRLGWNYGTCQSFWEDDRLMMSFVCTACGHRSGIHEVPRSLLGHSKVG